MRFATRSGGRATEGGTEEWFEAVYEARKENGEHLDEEEREAMPDFIKSASLELRHDLGMKWLRFYADRETIEGVDNRDKDRRRLHRPEFMTTDRRAGRDRSRLSPTNARPA